MTKDIKNKGGFTLVELMVVVIVIGILVAIAVPVYTNSQEKASKSACLANQRSIRTAAMQYFADKGTFPDTVQILVNEGYLQSMPHCSGKPYGIVDANGFAECPKDSEKHVLP